jgi:hypothetical protein
MFLFTTDVSRLPPQVDRYKTRSSPTHSLLLRVRLNWTVEVVFNSFASMLLSSLTDQHWAQQVSVKRQHDISSTHVHIFRVYGATSLYKFPYMVKSGNVFCIFAQSGGVFARPARASGDVPDSLVAQPCQRRGIATQSLTR